MTQDIKMLLYATCALIKFNYYLPFLKIGTYEIKCNRSNTSWLCSVQMKVTLVPAKDELI